MTARLAWAPIRIQACRRKPTLMAEAGKAKATYLSPIPPDLVFGTVIRLYRHFFRFTDLPEEGLCSNVKIWATLFFPSLDFLFLDMYIRMNKTVSCQRSNGVYAKCISELIASRSAARVQEGI
jgi:hypothetical protein